MRNKEVSIANLWERFNMTKMNKDLLHPLNDSEKQFNNSEQSNLSMEELIANLNTFDWDFGKIPSKHGVDPNGRPLPRKITLTLKNVGGVDSEWCFKLPNDNEIELEKWADPGDPTPEKAFEKHVLDKKIFTVSPRSGVLKPGEQSEVSVFYYPQQQEP